MYCIDCSERRRVRAAPRIEGSIIADAAAPDQHSAGEKAANIRAMNTGAATVHDALRAALALQQGGDLAAAEQAWRALIERFGSHADAEHMLGVTLHALGRSEESLPWFESAARRRGTAMLWNNHAAALLALGKGRDAVILARRAIAATSAHGGAWLNLGLGLTMEGNYGEAIAALKTALSISPGNRSAIRTLARSQLVLCDPAAALVTLQAIRETDDADADLLRVQALIATGDLPRASELLARIGGVDATRILNLEAQIAVEEGHSDRAIALYERVVADDPENREARTALAQLWMDRGEIDIGLEHQRRWLDEHPADNAIAASHLFGCLYNERMTPDALLAEHRRYPLVCKPIAARPRGVSKQLRVGWIKDGFGADLSTIFLEDVVRALPTTAPDIAHTFYSVGGIHRIAPIGSGWSAAQQDVRQLSDEQLIERLERDRIDILIDLMGRTTGNRACMFAARAAPVQIAWLDAFYTTGVGAMDYLISDPWLSPPGSDGEFTERLIRLPHGRLAYNAPPAPAPSVDAPHRQRFVSLNRFSKINAKVVEVWSAILQPLPEWTLLLKARGYDADLAAHIRARFARAGIDPQRIEIEGGGTYAEAMATYDRASVALDPFPFSGCSTTCDALWMGLPVVTWPGQTLASRQTAAWLAMAGKTEWIAADAASYIATAVTLAGNETVRRDWRINARDILRPTICDAERLARELADALRVAANVEKAH
jgi:predicted O-linked N-acetylglucosamine transferase (SPINDLY family)